MKIHVSQLIPLSFFASFGAPIAYVGYAFMSNLIKGKEVVFSTFSIMFVAVLFFSWFVMVGLACITFMLIRICQYENVNLLILSVCYLATIFSFSVWAYGLNHAWVISMLLMPNALIATLLSRRDVD